MKKKWIVTVLLCCIPIALFSGCESSPRLSVEAAPVSMAETDPSRGDDTGNTGELTAPAKSEPTPTVPTREPQPTAQEPMQASEPTEPAPTEAPKPDPTQPKPTEPKPTEAKITVPQPTEPPVTVPPATEPPVTESPATEPPVTEPPATEPPAAEPAPISPPVTEPAPANLPVTEPIPPEPVGCVHDWTCVPHDEEGHWIAGVICDCGWTFYGTADEVMSVWQTHSASFPPEEALLEHGGCGSMDEWIVDKPAYDEWVCCHCGEPKP